MYKSKELEAIIIEVVNKNKKNIIIGCIYHHPTMEIKEFNDKFFSPVMEKLSSEDKRIFLMGDYNIDLIKSDYDLNTSNLFDKLTSNLLVPHIIHPTRITSTSKTLIDNVFSNATNYEQGISGNLTVAISDHLAQFLIIELEFLFWKFFYLTALQLIGER